CADKSSGRCEERLRRQARSRRFLRQPKFNFHPVGRALKERDRLASPNSATEQRSHDFASNGMHCLTAFETQNLDYLAYNRGRRPAAALYLKISSLIGAPPFLQQIRHLCI